MHIPTLLTTLFLAASTVSANFNASTVYTTEVLTAYTTYCPAATSIVHGTQTYVVTSATTLTITNCPCTITRPVITSAIVSCSSCSSSAAAAPALPTTSLAPAPIYTNATAAAIAPPTTAIASTGLVVPTTTGSSAPAGASAFQGMAGRKVVGSGVGVAGLVGVVAFLL